MSTSAPHHHGNLREALVESAMEMLENGEPYTLRAVARAAGVSPTAPYRHYADKDALDAAVADAGYALLVETLEPIGQPRDQAVAYVEFALDHPSLFHVMATTPCDANNPDRLAAAEAPRRLLDSALRATFPHTEVTEDLGLACWALVHGLAALHLDGILPSDDRQVVAERVRLVVDSILRAH